jgi:streptogramin lyase
VIRFSYLRKLKSRIVRIMHLSPTVALMLPFIVPLIIPASTASASESFSEYSLPSGSTQPKGIVTSGGSMWYMDSVSSTPTLSNITTSGTITNHSIIPSGYSPYAFNQTLAVDASGNVWFDGCVTSSLTGPEMELGYMDPSTDTVTTFREGSYVCESSFGSTTQQPENLTVDASGNVWVVMQVEPTNYSFMAEFSPSGTLLSQWSPTSGGPTFNTVTAGPDDSLWAINGSNMTIAQLTLSSTGDTITGMNTYTPSGSGVLTNMTIGPDGNLWFGQSGGNIVKMTPSGTFTDYTLSSGSNPSFLTSGPDGAIWYVARNTSVVGRITTDGTSNTEYPIPTSSAGPWSITTGPDDALWFGEATAGKIGRIGY